MINRTDHHQCIQWASSAKGKWSMNKSIYRLLRKLKVAYWSLLISRIKIGLLGTYRKLRKRVRILWILTGEKRMVPKGRGRQAQRAEGETSRKRSRSWLASLKRSIIRAAPNGAKPVQRGAPLKLLPLPIPMPRPLMKIRPQKVAFRKAKLGPLGSSRLHLDSTSPGTLLERWALHCRSEIEPKPPHLKPTNSFQKRWIKFRNFGKTSLSLWLTQISRIQSSSRLPKILNWYCNN